MSQDIEFTNYGSEDLSIVAKLENILKTLDSNGFFFEASLVKEEMYGSHHFHQQFDLNGKKHRLLRFIKMMEEHQDLFDYE